MDPILNEESRTEVQAEPAAEPVVAPVAADSAAPVAEPAAPAAPATPAVPAAGQKTGPRKRKRRKKIKITIPAFLLNLGDDVRWYFDIRVWSPLILVVLILTFVWGRKTVKLPETTVPSVITVENLPKATVETTPPKQETVKAEEEVIPEAAALARLADSVGAGRSDNAKTAIMWVAINRSEDRANGYGQSLLDEIARPNQWQGYDENARYTEGTYAMAKLILETQARGWLRPLDSDMLWFVLNNDGSITLRNQFTASGNRKWVEKTIR